MISQQFLVGLLSLVLTGWLFFFFLKVNLHWLNRLGADSNRQRPSCQLVNLLNWSMIACTGSFKMWLWVLGHFILSKITPNKIQSLIDSSRNIRRWSSLSQAAWEFKSPWNEPKYLKQVQGYITYVTPYRNTRVKSEKIVTKFGESLNLVMFLVNISVKNDKQLKLLKKVIILFQFV